MIDDYCEQRMWLAINVNTQGVEPVAMITGLAFIVVPLLFPIPLASVNLITLQAGMIILGVGTIVFHTIRNEHENEKLNIESFDYVPIVFVLAMLLFMYLHPVFNYCQSSLSLMVIFALLSWAMFLVVSMDSYTFKSLNDLMNGNLKSFQHAILIIPLGLTLVIYSYYGYAAVLSNVWLYSLTSIVLWCVNYFVCEYVHVFALFHSIYHVLIAIAIWEAGCVANQLFK